MFLGATSRRVMGNHASSMTSRHPSRAWASPVEDAITLLDSRKFTCHSSLVTEVQASMGPRSIERGNSRSCAGGAGELTLQWGRTERIFSHSESSSPAYALPTLDLEVSPSK